MGFSSIEIEFLGSRNEEKRGEVKEARGDPGSERIMVTVEGLKRERVADMASVEGGVSRWAALEGEIGSLLWWTNSRRDVRSIGRDVLV